MYYVETISDKSTIDYELTKDIPNTTQTAYIGGKIAEKCGLNNKFTHNLKRAVSLRHKRKAKEEIGFKIL